MKTLEFKANSGGNWPNTEERQLAYTVAIYDLLYQINKKLSMKTTIQKVNETRSKSGSGKKGNGKKGANKHSNKTK